MRTFFSVILPVYNGESTINDCLNSIYEQSYKKFEVIVVNDGSIDKSVEIIKKFPCKLINLDKKYGPAYARNVGIRESKGNILFFIDSDTVISKNAFDLIYRTFKKEKNILGVISIPEKASLGEGTASNFNALKNHFSLYFTKDPYTNYFTTQAGALKKEFFKKYGYFNESYKEPHVEDVELGLRLDTNRIFINKDLLIKHKFPGFFKIGGKYFKRSILLSRLAKKNKKTPNKGHGSVKQFLVTTTAMVSLFFLISSFINIKFFFLFLSFLLAFFMVNFRLLYFIFKERGLVFMLVSIVYEYIFSIIINIGVFIGLLT